MIETIILLSLKLTCYQQYSQNGCFSCHSHDESIDCGYCGSIMSCIPGNERGSLYNECSNESWSYLNEYCDDKFCSSFKSKRDCKYPCAYSRIKGCIYNVEYRIYTSKMTLISLIIVSIISFLILIVVFIWACCVLNRHSLINPNSYMVLTQEQLDEMKQIRLDEIPSPTRFKQTIDDPTDDLIDDLIDDSTDDSTDE